MNKQITLSSAYPTLFLAVKVIMTSYDIVGVSISYAQSIRPPCPSNLVLLFWSLNNNVSLVTNTCLCALNCFNYCN